MTYRPGSCSKVRSESSVRKYKVDPPYSFRPAANIRGNATSRTTSRAIFSFWYYGLNCMSR